MIGSWIHRFSDKPGLLSLRAFVKHLELNVSSIVSKQRELGWASRASWPCTFCFSWKVLFGSLSASNIRFFSKELSLNWVDALNRVWANKLKRCASQLFYEEITWSKRGTCVAAWSAMGIADTALLAARANAWLDIRSRMHGPSKGNVTWHMTWRLTLSNTYPIAICAWCLSHFEAVWLQSCITQSFCQEGLCGQLTVCCCKVQMPSASDKVSI